MGITLSTFVVVPDDSILVTIFLVCALRGLCDLLHWPWGKGWITVYFNVRAHPNKWCSYHLHCRSCHAHHASTVSFLAQHDCYAILECDLDATYSFSPAVLD